MYLFLNFSYEVVLTIDKEKHKFDGPIYYYVFNSLLFSLLVLHILVGINVSDACEANTV